MNLLEKAKRYYAKRNSKAYIEYLRGKGIQIGEGTVIPLPRKIDIDTTRPSLITIGSNVRLNAYMTIMTHDAASKVFRGCFNDYVNSSGHITIGNNVYFGRYTTVLKGVTIGDNCVIGFGSTVMKDIPANSVAVGTPAKVICSIEEYYERRKQKSLEEAFEYMRSIKKRFGRLPRIEECIEEFPFFVNGNEVDKYPMLPIKAQLGPAYAVWCREHKAPFASFEDFIKVALTE